MSIFAISDLHLSLGCDKPMDIFGSKWSNYTERMQRVWNSIVTDDDLVIVPGDISWAMYIGEATADFNYIHSLRGKKLLLKGNHDYWWNTMAKMQSFLAAHDFSSIQLLFNNAYEVDGRWLCGTRGWTLPTAADSDDARIYARELMRMEMSLERAARLHARQLW